MDPDDKSDLGRIYERAKELFRLGEHERALEKFKSIYEIDIFFRDLQEIVDDYCFNIQRMSGSQNTRPASKCSF